MRSRKCWQHILSVLILLPLFVLSAHADMGPKPSVNVTIEGLDGRECWGTLLSEEISTGPYSALEFGSVRDPRSEEGDPDYPAWLAFHTWSQTDPDDYYFLQYVDNCSDGTFRWGYYPPQRFKLALWFPEEDALVVSGAAERFAFDSYYTIQFSSETLARLEQGQNITSLPIERSYPVAMEVTTFLVRAALTFGLELLIALLFVFRQPNLWKMLLVVNLTTQLLLNLVLNLYLHFCGSFIIMLFLVYMLAELAVVLVELLAYKLLLSEELKSAQKRVTCYTWTANLASFVFGIFLSQYAPILF